MSHQPSKSNEELTDELMEEVHCLFDSTRSLDEVKASINKAIKIAFDNGHSEAYKEMVDDEDAIASGGGA